MQFKSIGIVGAGTMGRGVAELVASRGLEVVLVDKHASALEGAQAAIEASLAHQLEKWGITATEKRLIQARIHFTTDLSDLAKVDFVIETIVEDAEAKAALFAELDQVCPAGVILASNSSTLSITELAAATQRPEQVIGLHFLNPAPKTKVVEVVRGLRTSDETFQSSQALVSELGKTGVEVFESPGYVTTRLFVPLINEAMYALMEGVATAEGIDTAMRLGYGFARGPLEQADRMGLDTLLVLMERLWRDYGDLKYRPCPLLRKLVRAGNFGVKSGEGFFKYDEEGNRLEVTTQ